MREAGLLLTRIFLAATGGLPMLALAGILLSVWLEPAGTLGGSWIRLAASLILIEFLLLHSGVFLAVGPVLFDGFWQRLAWFVGFGLLYMFGLLSYAYWTGNDYVLWLLVGVVASRLAALVILPDRRATILTLQRSAIGMSILLLTALLLLIPFPEYGLTDAVRAAAFESNEDLMSTDPQRLIAWGIVYFTVMAGIEAWVGWRLPDWTDAQVDQAWARMRRGRA